MSRSRPQSHSSPNPATRWFEWQGELGTIRYYDKDRKENIAVGLPFSFLLLDQLATVRGWHDASQSGIYANEVRDTRTDVLAVKAFQGGEIASGLYAAIKDRVNRAGAQFVANCYIAFRGDDGALALGALRFKGAALGSWMEFSKEHRADLYTKAVSITGYTEGKKGRITYRMPTFTLKDTSPQTDADAKALDATLQAHLDHYLARTAQDHDASRVQHEPPAQEEHEPMRGGPITDDDIPFAWLLPLVLPALASLSMVA